jgi:hypothetical protein
VAPARCLSHGLWFSATGHIRFAVLLSPAMIYGRHSAMHVFAPAF